jgi:alpha-galactosidase
VKIPVDFEQLGLKGKIAIRDLWNHKDLGIFSGEFAPEIINHGACLYRLSIVK